ncbi:MAG: VOC family protein [Actinomycetia bacterium]|nr:VOC family protein [Actinomycetes bacterium]
MAVHRLNHAVLYVRDVPRSVAFYAEALGFAPIPGMPELPGAAFLRAPGSSNDHDLGLFGIGPSAGPSAAGRGAVGLYHLAWEVDTLTDLADTADRLIRLRALKGSSDHSTTKALYAEDPDGLEFEVSWLVPADRIDDQMLAGRARIQPLDIDREIARFGAKTPGGIGVSRPALV